MLCNEYQETGGMGSKGEESRNVGREAIQDLSHNNGVIWVGMDGGGGLWTNKLVLGIYSYSIDIIV